MKVTSNLLRFTSVLLIMAICATAAQAQTRTIELKLDDGTILPITLKDETRLQLLSDGDIAATATPDFVCDQGTSCEDVEVSLSGTDGGDFSLSDSTVTQGVDFQVSWDARGAWDCTGSGLSGTVWNSHNPKRPSGTQKVSTDGLSTGTHQVEIVCENGPASASGALTLTVEEPTSEIAACDNITSLSDFSGWARSTDSRYPFDSDDPQTFDDVFTEWPGGGNSDLVSIEKGTYLAASFNSGPLTSSSDGMIRKEGVQGLGSSVTGADLLIMSISQCPGDFDPDSSALADDGCIQQLRSANQFYWAGPGSGASCELQANTDYFLNIVYTRSAIGTLPPEQAPCDDEPRCGHNYAPRGEF